MRYDALFERVFARYLNRYELIAIARTALADPLTRAWLTEARRGDGVSLTQRAGPGGAQNWK